MKNPPLNKLIWVTANNYTWFRVKLVYSSKDVHVYKRAYHHKQIGHNQPFSTVFRDWKYKLDGSEKEVR